MREGNEVDGCSEPASWPTGGTKALGDAGEWCCMRPEKDLVPDCYRFISTTLSRCNIPGKLLMVGRGGKRRSVMTQMIVFNVAIGENVTCTV